MFAALLTFILRDGVLVEILQAQARLTMYWAHLHGEKFLLCPLPLEIGAILYDFPTGTKPHFTNRSGFS